MNHFIKRSATLLLLSFSFLVKTYAGSIEEDILLYTNQYRQSKGKPALRWNEAASQQAREHSRNMARGRTGFGHGGFKDRANKVSEALGGISGAAENVAYGNMTAREVVNGWIKSKPHRKNLLGNYNLIGIGTARGKNGRIYFTQLFIKP